MLRQSSQSSVDYMKDMDFCSEQARKPAEDYEQLYVGQLDMLGRQRTDQ